MALPPRPHPWPPVTVTWRCSEGAGSWPPPKSEWSERAWALQRSEFSWGFARSSRSGAGNTCSLPEAQRNCPPGGGGQRSPFSFWGCGQSFLVPQERRSPSRSLWYLACPPCPYQVLFRGGACCPGLVPTLSPPCSPFQASPLARGNGVGWGGRLSSHPPPEPKSGATLPPPEPAREGCAATEVPGATARNTTLHPPAKVPAQSLRVPPRLSGHCSGKNRATQLALPLFLCPSCHVVLLRPHGPGRVRAFLCLPC